MTGMLCVVACARTDGDPPPQAGATVASVSEKLPAWFGLPNAATRPIKGQLWDGEVPLAGTVQLRIVAPDATVWTGIDQRTKADGQFDFGTLRAGRYVVLATAPGKTSRLVEVDTLEREADVALYAYRCKPVTRAVIANGRPLQGARIDLGGVVVATSDRAGKYTVCVSGEPMLATIRAPGWSAEPIALGSGDDTSAPDVLVESSELAGDVIEKNGKPAIGVAVQPIGEWTDRGEAIQATTDSTGRFTIRGAPKLDGGRLARYNFRVTDGTSSATDRTTFAVPESEAPVHVKLAYALHDAQPVTPATTVSGRIFHAGRPLADAHVVVPSGSRTFATRTHSDGTFSLAIDARGPLLVTVDHPTGLATARAIRIDGGRQALALTVELASTGTLAGVAHDRAGKPLARGLIHLRSRDTAVEHLVAPGLAGHFAIAGVELDQTYDLAITDGDTGEHATREVTLDAASPNITELQITTGR